MRAKFFKRKRFYFLLLAFSTTLMSEGFSQGQSPNLATRREAGGNPHEKITHLLAARQLLILIRNNAEAYREAKIARGYQSTGSVMGFAGGFLVGYSLGAALKGEHIEGSPMIAGGLLILASVPFHVVYLSLANKAIKMYNSRQRYLGHHTYDLQLNLAMNRVGLKLLFM